MSTYDDSSDDDQPLMMDINDLIDPDDSNDAHHSPAKLDKKPWEMDSDDEATVTKKPWEEDSPKSEKKPWETDSPPAKKEKKPWETDSEKGDTSPPARTERKPWEDSPKSDADSFILQDTSPKKKKKPWEDDSDDDTSPKKTTERKPWEDSPKSEKKPWEESFVSDEKSEAQVDTTTKREMKPWESESDNEEGVEPPTTRRKPWEDSPKSPSETDIRASAESGEHIFDIDQLQSVEVDETSKRSPRTAEKKPWEESMSFDDHEDTAQNAGTPQKREKKPWEESDEDTQDIPTKQERKPWEESIEISPPSSRASSKRDPDTESQDAGDALGLPAARIDESVDSADNILGIDDLPSVDDNLSEQKSVRSQASLVITTEVMDKKPWERDAVPQKTTTTTKATLSATTTTSVIKESTAKARSESSHNGVSESWEDNLDFESELIGMDEHAFEDLENVSTTSMPNDTIEPTMQSMSKSILREVEQNSMFEAYEEEDEDSAPTKPSSTSQITAEKVEYEYQTVDKEPRIYEHVIHSELSDSAQKGTKHARFAKHETHIYIPARDEHQRTTAASVLSRKHHEQELLLSDNLILDLVLQMYMNQQFDMEEQIKEIKKRRKQNTNLDDFIQEGERRMRAREAWTEDTEYATQYAEAAKQEDYLPVQHVATKRKRARNVEAPRLGTSIFMERQYPSLVTKKKPQEDLDSSSSSSNSADGRVRHLTAAEKQRIQRRAEQETNEIGLLFSERGSLSETLRQYVDKFMEPADSTEQYLFKQAMNQYAEYRGLSIEQVKVLLLTELVAILTRISEDVLYSPTGGVERIRVTFDGPVFVARFVSELMAYLPFTPLEPTVFCLEHWVRDFHLLEMTHILSTAARRSMWQTGKIDIDAHLFQAEGFSREQMRRNFQSRAHATPSVEEEIRRRDALQFVSEGRRASLLKQIQLSASPNQEQFPTYRIEKELEAVLDRMLSDAKMQTLLVEQVQQRLRRKQEGLQM